MVALTEKCVQTSESFPISLYPQVCKSIMEDGLESILLESSALIKYDSHPEGIGLHNSVLCERQQQQRSAQTQDGAWVLNPATTMTQVPAGSSILLQQKIPKSVVNFSSMMDSSSQSLHVPHVFNGEFLRTRMDNVLLGTHPDTPASFEDDPVDCKREPDQPCPSGLASPWVCDYSFDESYHQNCMDDGHWLQDDESTGADNKSDGNLLQDSDWPGSISSLSQLLKDLLDIERGSTAEPSSALDFLEQIFDGDGDTSSQHHGGDFGQDDRPPRTGAGSSMMGQSQERTTSVTEPYGHEGVKQEDSGDDRGWAQEIVDVLPSKHEDHTYHATKLMNFDSGTDDVQTRNRPQRRLRSRPTSTSRQNGDEWPADGCCAKTKCARSLKFDRSEYERHKRSVKERCYTANLRERYESLRRQIPKLCCGEGRVSRREILHNAIRLCQRFKKRSEKLEELRQRQKDLRLLIRRIRSIFLTN